MAGRRSARRIRGLTPVGASGRAQYVFCCTGAVDHVFAAADRFRVGVSVLLADFSHTPVAFVCGPDA